MRALAILLTVAACGEITKLPPDAPEPDAMPDGPPPSLALALEHASISSPRSIGVEIDVTITRMNVSGDVAVTVVGSPPTGVTAEPLTLADGTTTGTLVLDIGAAAALASSSLVIEARVVGGTTATTATTMLVISDTVPAFDASWSNLAAKSTRQLWVVPSWTSQPSATVSTRLGYSGMVTSSWLGAPTGITAATTTTEVTDPGLVVPEMIIASATAASQTAAMTLVLSDGTYRQTLALGLTIAKPPALDATIGTAGRLEVSSANGLTPVSADLDTVGRPIVAITRSNNASFARFTTAGVLDTTWAPSTLTPPFATTFEPADTIVQGNDTVITVGNASGAMVLSKLTAAGAPDTTFSGDGIMTVPTTGSDRALTLRSRSGKFYIAGDHDGDAAIVRVDSAGALDTTFGSGGFAILSTSDRFYDFTFDAGGLLVAAGKHTTGGVIARFNADGSIDTTFGTNGYIVVNGIATLGSVDVAVNGDIIAVGVQSAPAGGVRGVLYRFTSTGAPVTSFGTNGVVAVSLSSDGLEQISVSKVRWTATGIIVCGDRNETFATDFHVLVARYTDAGAPVTSFGTNGIEWILAGTEPERLGAVRATTTGLWLMTDLVNTTAMGLMRSTAGF